MNRLLVVLLGLLGCRAPFDVCAEVPPASLSALPQRLSETGLFLDGGSAPDVLAYTPSFELWSDGATKRRWLWLPPGATIDNRDPDVWRFPVGTKLWKEFSRDGVRVETRMMVKTTDADDGWALAAYVWRDGDAELTPAGALDVQGTPHDVPGADRCLGCHGGRPGRVLGFSAVQLDNGGSPSLTELGPRLQVAPQQSFRVPGTELERAALGYLYANCSHCHNQPRAVSLERPCYAPANAVDFSLNAAQLADVKTTAAYTAVVGREIRAGQPDQSRVVELISRRAPPGLFPNQMPPLGSDEVDAKAVELIRAWIASMR